VERVKPYLALLGPGGLTHVGALGVAKTMKIATNLGLAVQILAFSEAVLLAEKAGVPRATAVEALLKSVVASPMLRYRAPFVLGTFPRDAWFSVPMMQKDLQLALDQAHATGVPLPTAALAQEWLSMARGVGLGARDFATVFDVLAGLSGLPASPNR
jgi:3-hydroxyisobutyrate dehydrogenase-like beta-hydroxyacid dehydrogenase